MRIASIDQLKGLAIIGVVCYHLNDWRLGIDIGWMLMLIGWCVFAFLFAAGVLHGLKLEKKPATEFICQRARRLLVPFVLIGVIMCTLRQLLEASGSIDDLRTLYPPTLTGKIIGHLRLESPMVAYPLYFFVLLMVVSMIFKLLQAVGLSRSRLPWLAGGALGISFLGWQQSHLLPVTGFGWQMIVMGIYQYTCGHLLSHGSAPGKCPIVWIFTGILLLLSAVLQVPPFAEAAMPTLLFAGLERAEQHGWKLQPLTYLGERSATIYAYHAPFIVTGFVVVLHKLGVPAYLNLLLSLTGTLTVSSALHYVLHKWAVFKWFRV